MTPLKMLLFLFFLHLIKYSQRNVSMSHYDYIFFLFPFISSNFCLICLCFFVFKVPNCLSCLFSLQIVPLNHKKYLSLFHLKYINFKNKKSILLLKNAEHHLNESKSFCWSCLSINGCWLIWLIKVVDAEVWGGHDIS